MHHQTPRDLLLILVNARSPRTSVTYCLAVYGGGSGRNTQRLEKVLNFGLRVISGRRKFDHISDVRGGLGWPTARQLYELHSLNLLHEIHITEEPLALSSQPRANSLRSRSTRQDGDLALPRLRTEAGRRRLLFGIVSTVQRYTGLQPMQWFVSCR